MRHLNYSHLHYFWTVASEGSIARAAEVLHITPQTISGQLKLLEEVVGEPLFQRVGRGLVLTDTGRLVKQYADEIFSVGAELAQVVRSRQPTSSPVLNVGIVNSIAKLIAYRVLETGLDGAAQVRIVCSEGALEPLLADMAVHKLDLVISDRPIPIGLRVRAYNHTLGESAIGFFCKPAAMRRFRKNFPASLDGEAVLMPAHGWALRRELDGWFEAVGVEPRVVAEFDDSALLKMFGAAGRGVFPAPLAIAGEIERMYSARAIGEVEGVHETYYAISPDRRLKNPAVVEIIERAREQLFSPEGESD